MNTVIKKYKNLAIKWMCSKWFSVENVTTASNNSTINKRQKINFVICCCCATLPPPATLCTEPTNQPRAHIHQMDQ